MFNLPDIKTTRVYKDAFADGKQEIVERTARQLHRRRFTATEIAAVIGVPVAEVRKILRTPVAPRRAKRTPLK